MKINSLDHLQQALKDNSDNWVLIFKKGTQNSDCALKNIKEAANSTQGTNLFWVDVNETKDIHTYYGVASAPTLLSLNGTKLKNIIKGCNEKEYYKALFEDALYYAEVKNTDKPSKRVTVYSTPTCPWCTTLKNYLKQHRISFQDIDVSKDQNAAEELVRKSGQRGVPQTDIEGQMIVGFDKSKINQLLDIQ